MTGGSKPIKHSKRPMIGLSKDLILPICKRQKSCLRHCRFKSVVGRCRKGVDPIPSGSSKFLAIAEPPNDQIVQVLRPGKTEGAAHYLFYPGPQLEGFAIDCRHLMFQSLPGQLLL